MTYQATRARSQMVMGTILAVTLASILIPSAAQANVEIKDGNYVKEIRPSKVFPTAGLLTKDGKIVQVFISLPFRKRTGKLCTPFDPRTSPPHPKYIRFATIDKFKKKPDREGRFAIKLENMAGWDGFELTVKGKFRSSTSVSFSVFATRNGCSAKKQFDNAAFHEKIYTGPGWDK